MQLPSQGWTGFQGFLMADMDNPHAPSAVSSAKAPPKSTDGPRLFTGLTLPLLLGSVLAMSRSTLLVLPCSVAVKDEAQYISEAIAAVTAEKYMVGMRQLLVRCCLQPPPRLSPLVALSILLINEVSGHTWC